MQSWARFFKGMLKMPLPWQLWLLFLGLCNAVLPLFWIRREEAQLVLAAMLVNLVAMVLLTRISGFSRLLGLGHFPWFVLLYYLWHRLDALPAGDVYGLWLRILIGFNAVSLVIDVTDVVRYISGERSETVEGLSR